MKSAAVRMFAAPAAFFGGIVASGWWAGLPGAMVVLLGLSAVVFAVIQALILNGSAAAGRWGLPVAWSCTAVASIGLVDEAGIWSGGVAVTVFLGAASVNLVSRACRDEKNRARWLAMALTWAFGGGFIWLAAAYLYDQRLSFHAAVLANLALLVICKRRFRWRLLGVQVVNTLVLLLIGLPVASLLICGFGTANGPVDPARGYFSYEAGAEHPAKFAAWWSYFWGEWGKIAKEIQIHDNLARGLPFRLKRDVTVKLVQSEIHINRRGFRGAEIPDEKGNAYRIVALGESTTFGLTYLPTDKPWCERLEAMIRERLKLSRPVEVINAGVVSYDLKQNLVRLPMDILPLKPDMIISYHGFNGFRFVDSAMPAVSGAPPPAYEQRALQLLGDAEFKARTMIYNHHRAAELPAAPRLAADPMGSEYARAYRQLIGLANTNHIRLVLADFSMSVNRESDPKVIEFYRRGYPMATWAIRANEAHTTIVEQLARDNPQVCFVDTHPRLDGAHDDYIDLVHFSAAGEQAMAETMFDGIRNALEKDVPPADDAP